MKVNDKVLITAGYGKGQKAIIKKIERKGGENVYTVETLLIEDSFGSPRISGNTFELVEGCLMFIEGAEDIKKKLEDEKKEKRTNEIKPQNEIKKKCDRIKTVENSEKEKHNLKDGEQENITQNSLKQALEVFKEGLVHLSLREKYKLIKSMFTAFELLCLQELLEKDLDEYVKEINGVYKKVNEKFGFRADREIIPLENLNDKKGG